MEPSPEFVETVRELLAALADGREPPLPGGGLTLVLRETGAPGVRSGVAALVDAWFRPTSQGRTEESFEPYLNRPDVGEADKLRAVLHEHVVGRHRWQELSSNESTFYRYRRAAVTAFAERLWQEIVQRPIPTNRPRPEYVRLVGRRKVVAELLRLLTEPGGTAVGVEGPGGSGKTALLHAVTDACEAAARSWTALPADSADPAAVVPLFDAVVWASRAAGMELAALLDTIARTLDYPGLLARTVEDRREAVSDLLGRRAVLLVVDDVDLAEPGVLAFLAALPGRSRALVAARRRLPAEVRAVMPRPLASHEVRELLLAEAERQGAPDLGRALADSGAHLATPTEQAAGLDPLAAAARYPLLAGWAVGQLRRGQTVERVRDRLTRAEGEVFEEMFAASVAGLSDGARALLSTLPLLPAPANRLTLLAAGGGGADAALDELLETSLLEVSGAPTDADRRYALHAVTRSFVLARLPLDGAAERAAVARLADHYAAIAEAWGGAASNWRRFDRLEAELPNIMAILEASSRDARERDGEPPGAAFDQAILQLAHGMRNVFAFGRAWAEGLALFHRAIEAARRIEDGRAEGWNTYRLGALHYELGTAGYAEAMQRARQAVERFTTPGSGDPRGHGHALRLLGRAVRARGNVAEAERLLAEAERLLAVYGHGDDVGIARASRADLLRLVGRQDEATALYQDVLAGPLEDPGTEANIRHDLGVIALMRGDLEGAGTAFETAATLAEAAGARAIVARCRLGQARVAGKRGDLERARKLAAEAVDLFERFGDAERAHEARTLALDGASIGAGN